VNVIFENIDELNAKLKVQVQKEDYAEQVDSELKKLQKSVSMKGFRPGKTPIGLVKKLYGKSVLADQLNKIAVDNMVKYIQENKVDVLGQPLAATDSETNIDSEEEFEFSFDVGLAPEFKLSISAKDKVEKFFVEADDKDLQNEIEMIQRNFGQLDIAEKSEEDDIVYAYLTELNEDGTTLEGGIDKKEFSFSPKFIKDDKTKKSVIGLKAEDTINVDVFKLFADNDSVISHSLAIPKEGVSDLNKDFLLEIKEVKRMTPAELNQELFDKVFGKDTVKNEDELKAKITESLVKMHDEDSEKMLNTRIMNTIVDKHKLSLPDGFLKRWLVKTKEDVYTPENVDEKYEKESITLKWTLIKEKVMEEKKLEVDKTMIEREAEFYIINEYQRMGYGMPSPEMIDEYKPKLLQNESMVRNFHDVAADKLVLENIKESITIKDKKLAKDKFQEKWNELQY
jgi:trigger factor